MKSIKQHKPYFIIIYGPTGVGKTDFSWDLAQVLPNAQIINADLGQLYVPLTIGTAKPDLRKAPVPHHLFDILDRPVHYTVQQYRQRVISLMREFWNQGITPIIVGGSGFYIKSLLFPPCEFDGVEKKEVLLQETSNEINLWQKLSLIDPERAANIHPHDTYRIERALEIWHTTGQKPSLFAPCYTPPSDYMLIHLTRTRDDLYTRIDQRVKIMIEQGWINEVISLIGTEWELFLHEKKLIGYDDIIQYIHGQTYKDMGDLIATIAKKTRNYAKRQETFWRMLVRCIEQTSVTKHSCKASIKSLNLTLSGVDLYIKELSKEIQRLYGAPHH